MAAEQGPVPASTDGHEGLRLTVARRPKPGPASGWTAWQIVGGSDRPEADREHLEGEGFEVVEVMPIEEAEQLGDPVLRGRHTGRIRRERDDARSALEVERRRTARLIDGVMAGATFDDDPLTATECEASVRFKGITFHAGGSTRDKALEHLRQRLAESVGVSLDAGEPEPKLVEALQDDPFAASVEGEPERLVPGPQPVPLVPGHMGRPSEDECRDMFLTLAVMDVLAQETGDRTALDQFEAMLPVNARRLRELGQRRLDSGRWEMPGKPADLHVVPEPVEGGGDGRSDLPAVEIGKVRFTPESVRMPGPDGTTVGSHIPEHGRRQVVALWAVPVDREALIVRAESLLAEFTAAAPALSEVHQRHTERVVDALSGVVASGPSDERGRLLVESLRRASGDVATSSQVILAAGGRDGLADLLSQAADHIAGGVGAGAAGELIDSARLFLDTALKMIVEREIFIESGEHKPVPAVPSPWFDGAKKLVESLMAHRPDALPEREDGPSEAECDLRSLRGELATMLGPIKPREGVTENALWIAKVGDVLRERDEARERSASIAAGWADDLAVLQSLRAELGGVWMGEMVEAVKRLRASKPLSTDVLTEIAFDCQEALGVLDEDETPDDDAAVDEAVKRFEALRRKVKGWLESQSPPSSWRPLVARSVASSRGADR